MREPFLIFVFRDGCVILEHSEIKQSEMRTQWNQSIRNQNTVKSNNPKSERSEIKQSQLRTQWNQTIRNQNTAKSNNKRCFVFWRNPDDRFLFKDVLFKDFSVYTKQNITDTQQFNTPKSNTHQVCSHMWFGTTVADNYVKQLFFLVWKSGHVFLFVNLSVDGITDQLGTGCAQVPL